MLLLWTFLKGLCTKGGQIIASQFYKSVEDTRMKNV